MNPCIHRISFLFCPPGLLPDDVQESWRRLALAMDVVGVGGEGQEIGGTDGLGDVPAGAVIEAGRADRNQIGLGRGRSGKVHRRSP